MADSKISELTALTSAAAADVLPIVDTSATATKKITVTDLFTGTVFNEDGDSVDTRFEGDTKINLLFVDGSEDKVGINFDSPALRLHVVNDEASSPVYATTQCAVFEDDNRPGIQMVGSANNIALIDFGDNAASNSGGIDYKHASDSFAFVAAGDEQVSISNGVLGPITDSDVDLGTSSLYFKNAYIDAITTTGNVSVGGNLDVTGSIDFSDSAITNAGDIQLDSITGDGDTDTSITFSGSNVITFKAANANQITMTDGAMSPVTDSDVDLGTASLYYKDAYIDSITTTGALNGALKRWTVKTSAYTAVAGDRILADTATTAAFTITLPASPAVGDEIHILDSAANFDSANLTVARNSLKIQGLTADLTLTTENTGIGLVYMSSTYGWRVLIDAYDVDTTEL